jgi:CheY-like chemotaxis protein
LEGNRRVAISNYQLATINYQDIQNAFDTGPLQRYPSTPNCFGWFDSQGSVGVKSASRVLIVDASPESREVLRLLLERRGVRTLEADRTQDAIRLAGQFRPDLIVLDAESDPSSSGNTAKDLRQAAGRGGTPIVILGKFRQVRGLEAGDEFVAKPYHYGPLIRKIDGLLGAA